MLASLEAAYRSALTAMGKSAMDGHEATSAELQRALADVAARIAERRDEDKPDPDDIKKADAEVSRHLGDWGLRTAEHLKRTAEEFKSLLVAVAETADAVGERDHAYAEKLKGLTNHLDGIARLDDMSRMRASILKSATELKQYVREIVENSAQTAIRFKSQIKTYEDKLAESEQRRRRDSLTKLYNRHGMEGMLNRHVEERREFSLVMVDLDNFKSVNDQHGHLAGDELLKQFAQELKSSLRTLDILGRWGGDEFILILEGNAQEAGPILDRMRRLVVGEYVLPVGTQKIRVTVEASFGVADFRPGETAAELMERADAAMYSKKDHSRRHKHGFTAAPMTAESLPESRSAR